MMAGRPDLLTYRCGTCGDARAAAIEAAARGRQMIASLKLLLPALTPSWRFFDSVGPSPRIEYLTPAGWRELRPRPAVVTWRQMLTRLLWNPERNESLFLTSCAERLLEAPNAHSVAEIEARLAAAPWRQWRLVRVSRCGAQLEREIAYVSPMRP